MSGRKNEEQIGEVRVINSFQGGRIPLLKRGEVICPVCSQPGFKKIPDGKPGQVYGHTDRMVVCRFIDEKEVPRA